MKRVIVALCLLGGLLGAASSSWAFGFKNELYPTMCVAHSGLGPTSVPIGWHCSSPYSSLSKFHFDSYGRILFTGPSNSYGVNGCLQADSATSISVAQCDGALPAKQRWLRTHLVPSSPTFHITNALWGTGRFLAYNNPNAGGWLAFTNTSGSHGSRFWRNY